MPVVWYHARVVIIVGSIMENLREELVMTVYSSREWARNCAAPRICSGPTRSTGIRLQRPVRATPFTPGSG